MNYENSCYYIASEYNDKYILYSTLTTSLTILDKDVYIDIFERNQHDKYPSEVQNLLEMGFVHEQGIDEEKQLAEQRKLTVQTNKDNILYYIITPTMDCNARCYYCFEQGAHHQKMSKETAIAVANYIVKNAKGQKICIQWFGGEPLLEPDVIDLITEILNIHSIDYESKITTNGFLLSNSMVQRIRKWNTTSVQIPIDAIGNEYNNIKRYIDEEKDAFSKVIGNIKNLLKYDIRVRVRINFNPLEIETVKKTIIGLKEIFGEKSPIEFYCASIDSPSSKIPPISLRYEGLEKHPLISLLDISEEFCGYSVKTSNTWFATADELTKILQKYFLHPIPASCFGVCNCTIAIDSLGNIYVCHRLLGKGEQYSSGNVWSGIENNGISERFQSIEIREECRTCFLLPCCQGGCKLRAEEYGVQHACSPAKGVASELLLRALKKSDIIR